MSTKKTTSEAASLVLGSYPAATQDEVAIPSGRSVYLALRHLGRAPDPGTAWGRRMLGHGLPQPRTDTHPGSPAPEPARGGPARPIPHIVRCQTYTVHSGLYGVRLPEAAIGGQAEFGWSPDGGDAIRWRPKGRKEWSSATVLRLRQSGPDILRTREVVGPDASAGWDWSPALKGWTPYTGAAALFGRGPTCAAV